MKVIITILFLIATLYLFSISNIVEPKESNHTMKDYLKETR